MSEEEKATLEFIKINNKHRYCDKNDVDFLLNLIEKQQKELDNIKEIEKSHKEENGKLRVEYEKVYEDNLTLAHELEQEKEKNKELEKYDYRKIKFDDRNKIKSPSFTKEQLELMNLGICLYVALPKILTDEENEDEEEI